MLSTKRAFQLPNGSYSTLHWESAPQCPLPTGKLHCCYDGSGCHVGKRSKLLIGGWSLAGVWLFGKWALLRYIGWKTIWQPQQLLKIICFVIEAEGLLWGIAFEVVFLHRPAPSELSVSLCKEGSEWGHRFVLCHILFSVHSLQVLSHDRSSL